MGCAAKFVQKSDGKQGHRSRAVVPDRGRSSKTAKVVTVTVKQLKAVVAVLGLFIKHSVLHPNKRTEAAQEFSFRRYTKILADVLGTTKDIVYELMATETAYTQCYE